MTDLSDEEADADELPISERRERGLNDLAAVIEKIWGPRCSRHEGGCHCCVAWTMFDCMEKLTDTSVLDD